MNLYPYIKTRAIKSFIRYGRKKMYTVLKNRIYLYTIATRSILRRVNNKTYMFILLIMFAIYILVSNQEYQTLIAMQ